MITFPATDIEYALQDEIDSLKEENEWLRSELAYHLWQRGLGPKPPVGKEWGRMKPLNSYPLEDYNRYAI
jgi:hypothetical protein